MPKFESLRPEGDANKTTVFNIADHPELKAAADKAKAEREATEAKKAAEAKSDERGVFSQAEIQAHEARIREALRARSLENPSDRAAA